MNLAPLLVPYLPTLITHIAAGCVGIVAGYTAVAVRKGERVHRIAGTVFVLSMLIMATVAVYMAVHLQDVMTGQKSNIAAGILAAYLIATAYVTVKRKENSVGMFEKIAAVAATSVGAVFLLWGALASMSPGGELNGRPAILYFILAGFAVLFALFDLRVIRSGGLAGTARIARHLWRMCLAFFLAAGSFFLGQQKVLPAWMHGAWYLYVLGFAPLGFMAYWLIYVHMRPRIRAAQVTP